MPGHQPAGFGRGSLEKGPAFGGHLASGLPVYRVCGGQAAGVSRSRRSIAFAGPAAAWRGGLQTRSANARVVIGGWIIS